MILATIQDIVFELRTSVVLVSTSAILDDLVAVRLVRMKKKCCRLWGCSGTVRGAGDRTSLIIERGERERRRARRRRRRRRRKEEGGLALWAAVCAVREGGQQRQPDGIGFGFFLSNFIGQHGDGLWLLQCIDR